MTSIPDAFAQDRRTLEKAEQALRVSKSRERTIASLDRTAERSFIDLSEIRRRGSENGMPASVQFAHGQKRVTRIESRYARIIGPIIAERTLEDHEDVTIAHKEMNMFPSNRVRKFTFRQDYLKYEFFFNPKVSKEIEIEPSRNVSSSLARRRRRRLRVAFHATLREHIAFLFSRFYVGLACTADN